jgi:cysteine desulfurase
MSKKIPDVFLNGPELTGERLANNLNVRFAGLEGEVLVLYLDAYGIIAATGSACASANDEASHVLTACGLSHTDAKSSVRFTLGKSTDKKAIDYVMKYLPGIVAGIRAMQKV